MSLNLSMCAVIIAASGTAMARAQEQTGPDDLRAAIADTLADAETRSSLLSGGDAGHDGRFYIAGDGFRLNVGGLSQFRYLADFRNNANPDSFDHGFEYKRMQLWFEGQLNGGWDFKVMGFFADAAAQHFAPQPGVFTLQDAYARYNFANGLKLTCGQFKLPLLREELVFDQYQLTGERSLVNWTYTAYRAQGAMLAYQSDSWRGCGAVSSGLNSPNTDFTTSAATPAFVQAGQADYALTGRLDYRFTGDWKMFDDFGSLHGQDFGAMLGGAVHWQQSKDSNLPNDVDQNTLEYTADATLKGNAWSFFGAFIGRYTKDIAAAGNNEYNDFGGVVQGGWRFAANTEAFARWDAIFVDSSRVSNGAGNNFHFLTAGVNHYFAGQAAKLTLDVVYSFNNTLNLQTLGVLPNSWVGLQGANKPGETAVRCQFQLLF